MSYARAATFHGKSGDPLKGKPNHILDTFLTGTIPGDGSPALVTVNSGVHSRLTVGEQYFIILGGGPAGGWFYDNSLGDVGPVVNGLNLLLNPA